MDAQLIDRNERTIGTRYWRNARWILSLAFAASLLAGFSSNAEAVTKTAATGNWGTAGTWTPSGVPLATDDVIIPAGVTVTMDGNTGAALSLTINGTANWTAARTTNIGIGGITTTTGGTITGTVTGTLTTTGNLTVPSGATLTIGAANVTISGTTSVSGTLAHSSATGTKTFTGLVTIASGGSWTNTVNEAITFGGGLANNGSFASGTGAQTFTYGGLTNNGTLTAGTGAFTFTTNAQSISGSATTIPNVTITAITLTNNIASGGLTVGTALSGTGGLTQATNAILNIGGTSGITTLTATAAGNTVNYTGAAQTVKATTYNDLTLGGSGAKTLPNAAWAINGDLTLTGTATGATRIATTIGGNLDVQAGTTLTVGAFNITVSGTTSVTGTLAHSSATGTKTYTGLVTINTGGSLTNAGAAAITFTNGVANNAACNVGNGAITYGNGFLNNAGGTFTTGTGAQTFTNGGLTNNGTVTAGTGAFTFTTNAQSISGSATTIPNVTVTGITLINNITSGGLTVGTALSGTGGLTQAANAILNIGGTSGITTLTATAAGNTVKFSGAAQTVKATTYNNLTLSGSGAKTFPAGTTTVNGVLSMEGTATTTVTGTLTYGTAATLQYNRATALTAGGEWIASFSSSGGIIIANTSAITMNSAKIVNAPLTINSGATLATGNFGLTFGGDFINSGTFTAGSSPITISGTGTQSIAGFTTTGALSCTKTGGTANIQGNVSAASLTLSGAGGTLDLGSSTHSINGNLVITAGILDAASSTFTVTGTTSVTGTLTHSSSTGTKRYTGLVTINPGGIWNNSGNSAINFRGGLTNNGTFTAGTGVYTFDTNSQVIGGAATSIPNLTVTTPAVLTNNITTGGLTVGTALSGTGGLTQGASAILNIGGTSGITTLTATANPNTVNYNGAGAQTVRGTTYNILKINNGAGATLGAAATVTTLTLGDVTVNSMFDDGGFGVTSAGTLNLTSGTFKIGAASYPAFAANTISAGTTVEYNGGGAQTVSLAPSYQNLTFSGAGTKTTASGTLTIGGTWSVGSAAALNTNNTIVNLAGDLAGGGGISQGTGAINISGNWTNNGTYTSVGASVVNYNGGGAQTVSGTPGYQNLTFSGAGTKTLGGATTVNGNLNIAAGTLDAGAGNFALNVKGNWTNSGTFNPRSGTVTFNGSGAQTINSSNTWYGLAITGSAARTVFFQSGAAQTIAANGSLTFAGASGQLLTLAPLTGGSAWLLNFNGATQNISYASVSYSNAGGGASITADATNVNGGNNINWHFASTTAVASVLNPSTYGQAATFTATVTGSGGTPSGNVQFKIDGADLGGPLALTGGVVSKATATLTAGSHVVTADYLGDIVYSASTGTLGGGQTVNKAALTITAQTNTKPYDGTLVSATTPTVSGLQGGDTVTGLAEAYTDKYVGTGKTLAVTAYTVNDGNSGSNYTVTTVNDITGAIVFKALTVTGITANNKLYDGNTTATLNTGAAVLTGVVAPDDVTLNTASATGAFSDANVGAGKTVTVSGLSVIGADSGNYWVTQPTTTASITNTNPVFSATSPASDSYRNTATVGYTLDKLVTNGTGTITFTRTDGSEDPGSPHYYHLTAPDLTSGSHTINTNLSLVNGAIYTVSFDVTDDQGYAATTVNNTNILYDAAAASVTLDSPAASSSVNSATVRYTLSKEVASGTIIFTRTGGSGSDALSPHIYSFLASDRTGTSHTVNTGLSLVDGVIYTVSIEDIVDLEGNASASVFNTSVKYDITAVAISGTSPSAGGATATAIVSYSLSEQALAGKVTFTKTAGPDPLSSSTFNLTGSDLDAGAHTMDTALPLVDGTVYTVSFDATDQAGNPATTVSSAGVTFDQTAPLDGTVTAAPGNTQNVLTWSGYTDAASGINSYTLVSSPTATPADCSGTPLTTAGTGTTYIHTALTNGVTYYYRVCATDRAGNSSAGAAAFAVPRPDAYNVTAQAGPNGSISCEPASVLYNLSSVCTITANGNYHVADVLVDGSTVGAVTSYMFNNVTADHTIAATFAIDTRTVTASAGANGSISPSGAVSVNYGASQGFLVTPDAGYHLMSMVTGSGCAGVYSGMTYTAGPITVDCAVTAIFTINTNTITASAGGNGSISPSGAVSVDFGATQGFTITPNAQYHVADVLVDGLSVGAVTSYTFTNVTGAHTIAATMAADPVVPPAFSSTSPATGSYVNTDAIGYTLNRLVSDGTGTIAFTWTSGNSDGNSPHHYKLTTADMTAGSHNISSGWSSGSGGLVNGAIYTVTFDLIDGGLYSAPTVTNTDVLYDASAAYITLTSPAGNSIVNNATAGYTLSKAVASGTIVYTRTSGTADSGSPHTYTLSAGERAAGSHSVDTGFTLADGTVYSVAMENVVDLEGNSSAVVENINVRYDVTAVAFTSTSPLASSATATATVGYTLSEQASAGKVTFTRTGGAPDASSPQVYTMAGTDLTAGPHTVNTNLGLVDGTIYTISFDATDLAGNHATTVSNAGVTFDQTAPLDGTVTAAPGNTQNVLSWSGYADAASGINSYALVSSTTATPINCGGTPLSTGTGMVYTHTGLTNGVTYYYRVCATDYAGNISAGATAQAAPKPDAYNVTTQAGPNGSISCSPSSVAYNGSSECTITPDTGYHVADVSVGPTGGTLSSVGVVTAYSINNVVANTTIAATFAVNTYEVTTAPGPNGSIACIPTTVNYNSGSVCTVTPNSGYSIADVTVGPTGGTLTSVGAVTAYTIRNIAANMTIAATFGGGTPPTAGFTWTTDPALDYKVFYNATSSTCPSGATCTYSWSTGETGVTASHTFADTTTTTVTLTVTASTGLSSSVSKSVTPKYMASTPTSLGAGLTVTPGGFSPAVNWTVAGGVAPYQVRVNWGDGTTTPVTQPAAGPGSLSHTFVTARTYTVSVYAIDTGVNGSNMTSATASTTVVIAPSTITISGKVTQSNGTTPVSSVALTLKQGTVAKKLAYTDASGNYTMTGVAAGTYTMTATRSGYTFPAPVAVDTTAGNQTVNISSMTP